jgi:protease PrsW
MLFGLVSRPMSLTELVPGLIVASAIAPALLLLWLVVAADSRPEPPRLVWISAGLAALSGIPVGLLELWLARHIPITGNPTLGPYETALFLAGIPEETVKIAIIAVVALRARDFDEPMDGVVYGTAVGLGFAAIENVFYVAGDTDWAFVAVTRGVLSVPFHGALGAIAGAYIALARFGGALGAHHGRWRRPRLFLLAWLVPVVLHTLFDGSLFSLRSATPATGRVVLMLLIALAVGFGGIGFAVHLARRIARRQKAWLQTKRLPPAHWRTIWARLLLGLGLSLVAVALIIAGDTSAKIAGCVLMAVAIAVSRHCAKHLSDAAKLRHHRAAVASS